MFFVLNFFYYIFFKKKKKKKTWFLGDFFENLQILGRGYMGPHAFFSVFFLQNRL